MPPFKLVLRTLHVTVLADLQDASWVLSRFLMLFILLIGQNVDVFVDCHAVEAKVHLPKCKGCIYISVKQVAMQALLYKHDPFHASETVLS